MHAAVLTALFPPVPAESVRRARAALALLIGARVALGPYASLAGQPAELFRPIGIVRLLPLDGFPSAELIKGVQATGVLAAAAVLRNRCPRAAFAATWSVLLLLAGLRTSLGKVLHNDSLLLLAAIPFLFVARSDASTTGRPRRAHGWPLGASATVVCLVYFLAGLAKLVNSGPRWVFSDNLRYVMAQAHRGGQAAFPEVAKWIAMNPWVARSFALAILVLELAFPLALWRRRWRKWFGAAAIAFHAGTWLALGLDYWMWAATAAVVLLDAPNSVAARSQGRAGRCFARPPNPLPPKESLSGVGTGHLPPSKAAAILTGRAKEGGTDQVDRSTVSGHVGRYKIEDWGDISTPEVVGRTRAVVPPPST